MVEVSQFHRWSYQDDFLIEHPVQQLDHGFQVHPAAGRVHPGPVAARAFLGDAAPRLGRLVGCRVDHAGALHHEVGGAVAARWGTALAEVRQMRHVQLALSRLSLARYLGI